MKYRNLRELVPVIALSALVASAYLSDDALAKTQDNLENKEISIPKNVNDDFLLKENDIIVLNLSDLDLNYYDVISLDCIDNIEYTNDNEHIIIRIKNSEIYYDGYYNYFYQKYIYDKKNIKEKIYSIK